ncbi:MAG: response regulator transcription factor [Acidobacteria bacterium]|nr:response regulator transcription factor [Acidobacteriota bacterium]
MAHDTIRVLIADDHPVVRKGLLAILQEDKQIEVIAEAGDGEAALSLIGSVAPHVAVLDFDMPKRDGLSVAREALARGASSRFILLTLHADADLFRTALEAGFLGYLLKDSALMEIAAAVHAVAGGRPFLSSEMSVLAMRAAAGASAPPRESPLGRLTPTERRILSLIGEGQSSKEIGESLSIHYRTVENHRTNICRKLGLEGANALVRFSLQNREPR